MDFTELLAALVANQANQGRQTKGHQVNSSRVLAGYSLLPPLVTREEFAHLTGLSPGTIQGFINKSLVPTVMLGRHRLVNLELVAKMCSARAFHDRRALYASAAENDTVQEVEERADSQSEKPNSRKRPVKRDAREG